MTERLPDGERIARLEARQEVDRADHAQLRTDITRLFETLSDVQTTVTDIKVAVVTEQTGRRFLVGAIMTTLSVASAVVAALFASDIKAAIAAAWHGTPPGAGAHGGD